MDGFSYTPPATAIYFGNGRFSEIGAITASYGLQRILLLSTASARARDLAVAAGGQLGARLAGHFDGCIEQVPIESAEAVQALARELDVDGVVAVGGGSTIGHGKAVARTQDIKLLHVVTTYSGSEMTDIQGFTRDGVKRVEHDPRMRAAAVIYDPELTLSLPGHVSGPSGINGMAHCVEALYGQQGNPVISLYGGAGIKALRTGLPQVVARPDDLQARGQVLYGAYMSGLAISAGTGLHHAAAHVLGGSFGIPHAQAHTLALPHTIAYNRAAVPAAMAILCEALGCEDGPKGLFDLAQGLGIDMALSKLGFTAGMIDKAVGLLLDHPFPNPRPLERAALVTMFEAMVEGRRPD